jgi:hypothetical protein
VLEHVLHHRRHPARVVEVLHHVLAARLEVREKFWPAGRAC